MATARISKAQREREALDEFSRMLGALPDPRRKQGQRHPFESVIVIALMSMVCGADDASGMEVWGELNEEFLSDFLPLPHGTPSQDVFLAVFEALKPDAFNAMFLAWEVGDSQQPQASRLGPELPDRVAHGMAPVAAPRVHCSDFISPQSIPPTRCRSAHHRRPVSRSRRPESTRISTVVFASRQEPYAMR